MIDFFSTNDSDYKTANSINIPDSSSDQSNLIQSSESNDSDSSSCNNNLSSNTYSLMSNDDEPSFDALNPFEKFCKLCDNPTPSNM